MDTVRAMTENGSAYCILGNHEFNAISYFTKDKDGQLLRKLSTIPNIALPQKAKAKHFTVPTIVGHYWLNSEAVPCPMSKGGCLR